MDKNIVISLKTIAQALLVALGIYAVFKLSTIIGLVASALLITVSLENTIQFVVSKKVFDKPIKRPLGVLIVYFAVFMLGAAAVSVGLAPGVTQIQKLVQTLIKHQEILTFGGNVSFSFSDLVTSFLATSGGVLSATKALLSNLAAVFSVLVLAIYMSIDWDNIKRRFVFLFKESRREKVGKILGDVEFNVGVWLRGELLLMLLIGVLSYVGLFAVGVQFPLALAIISGVFEIVPIIGPVASAIVAALVAVIDSPVKAVIIVLVYALIQQLEGNILVPKVMSKVSGLNPIIILIGLLVGSHLFGIIGAIAAVPMLMIGAIILKSIIEAN